MEQIYAKILLPNEDYNSAQVKSAMQDPLYKDFIEFKDELVKKLGAALGIGYGNGRAFLKKLNQFSIRREDFEKKLREIKENTEGKKE